jgi:hypothetical protein
VSAAVRAALTDYFFNSLRLVAVNVGWGATLVAIVLVALAWPIGGLVLLPVLAVPTAMVFRTAARVVRTDGATGDDDPRAAPLLDRVLAGRALAAGAGVVVASSVLIANAAIGLGRVDPIGWTFATLAGWGLVAVAGGCIVGWPLLVDPARDGRTVNDRLVLAARVLLVHPGRVIRLCLAVTLILAVSTVLTAAILTVSLAFVALVLCRSVYPLADPLDAERPAETDTPRP